MESELLETMLDDFKSELTNRLDGTMKHSDIRIAYLKKAIDSVQNELRKNMFWNPKYRAPNEDSN